MRLDKYLVDCGVGSRTEVKQVLKQKKDSGQWKGGNLCQASY